MSRKAGKRTSISDLLKDTDYHEGNEVVVKPMSNIEALTHLKGLILYQEQSPDEVFTSDELNALRRKISTFEYLIDKAKKQSSLDCYLEK
ncbi:4339_t:CDS:2 [Paraglomus brasilianum]|uniref:4339_t:CDS:1 n=1 Tax=Paraglomus brasilianum TaxID=144538 RepID=A0A9N9H964_9GLOM|nr:4339_t:CDS:2 [Paraglomus brasilianum]